MNDMLSVLMLTNNLLTRLQGLNALIMTMRAEGRDTLTPEEIAQLQSDDDEARQALVDAIQNS